MGQNTGTADGLFPDSEIAKQLVAQFIHNMLVKTSPWPQVCFVKLRTKLVRK